MNTLRRVLDLLICFRFISVFGMSVEMSEVEVLPSAASPAAVSSQNQSLNIFQDVIKILQEQDVQFYLNKNDEFGMPRGIHGEMLLAAAIVGNSELAVKSLLLTGIDKNRTNLLGETPLFNAVNRGHFGIVLMLLDAGVDVNKTNLLGVTPLYCASSKGNVEIVRLLLNAGAKKDECDNNGELLCM